MSHSMVLLDLAGSIVTMAVIAVDLIAVTQAVSGSFAASLLRLLAGHGSAWPCSSGHSMTFPPSKTKPCFIRVTR
jgi:hypothetical protein